MSSEFAEVSAFWSDATVGRRIADARRRAGLSQRSLANRIGTSIWKLDQMERGKSESSQVLAAIADATGKPQSWFASSPIIEGAIAGPRSRAETQQTLELRERMYRDLVLWGLAILVLIRFFTEVIGVIPRAANFIDIPIALVLFVAAGTHFAARSNSRARLAVAAPVLVFTVICVISTITNLSRVAPGPVLVFLYGFLAPLAVYVSVYQLWPVGSAAVFSRLLVWLGIAQLAVVFTIDLARFSSNHDPDEITGTFGTNQNQLTFFLLIVATLLAGVFTFERRRLSARLAPALIPLTLGAILLAQYRALLATVALSILLVTAILSSKGRGLVVGLFVAAAFVTTLSYVASHFPELKFASTVTTYEQRPGFYISKKIEVFHTITRLYTDEPRFIITGTGPGTFSSRAWQTFGRANSRSPLLAEVGVPGFLAVVFIYLLAATRSVRLTIRNLKNAAVGDPLPALLIATSIAFIALLQMGFLDNWFETTRATFLVWTMLAIVTKELSGRLVGG